MIVQEYSKSDLLAYALFDLDPRVQELRQPLLTFLISLALFELDRPATREELLTACSRQFLSGDQLPPDEIDQVIAVAVDYGLLTTTDQGMVDLSGKRREDMKGAASRIAKRRIAFHGHIARVSQEELGDDLSPQKREKLEKALDQFIQELFYRESISLARAFGPDGAGFDDYTQEHVTGMSLSPVVSEVFPDHEQLRRAQLAQGIRKGMLKLNANGQQYLAAVYQRTVAFALLQQDPTVRKVKRDLAKQRTWYLDTNVAMALMFSGHPRHQETRAAVDAARDIGCELLVSPFTIEELNRRLKIIADSYEKVHRAEPALSGVKDDVLRTFALRREQNPGLRWNAFHATYYPSEGYLRSVGVSTSEAGLLSVKRDARRDEVQSALRRAKAPQTDFKIIEHDTNNLLLVQNRRRKYPSDVMGSRIWLITHDKTLMPTERELVRDGVYPVHSSKRVDEWAADLSPHLSPDDLDLGEYALHLVQSQLGILAEDPIFADVNFLATLVESPFDLDELLNGDADLARQVLVALQEENEVAALLKRRPLKAEDNEEWAKELSAPIERALAGLDRTTEKEEALTKVREELKRAQSKAMDARRERDLARRYASGLERDLEQQKSSDSDGLIARLKRVLRSTSET